MKTTYGFVMITILIFIDVCVLEWVRILTTCLWEIIDNACGETEAQRSSDFLRSSLCPGMVHRLITAWPVGLCGLYVSAS